MCVHSESGVCCGKHGCCCCREKHHPPEYPVAKEFYDDDEYTDFPASAADHPRESLKEAHKRNK